MLCGFCGLPVVQHRNAVQEMVPHNGGVRKQLYHKKRCWHRELRRRRSEERRREQVAAGPLDPMAEVAAFVERRMGVTVPTAEPTTACAASEAPQMETTMADDTTVTVERAEEEPAVTAPPPARRKHLYVAVYEWTMATEGRWFTAKELFRAMRGLGYTSCTKDSSTTTLTQLRNGGKVALEVARLGNQRLYRVEMGERPPVPTRRRKGRRPQKHALIPGVATAELAHPRGVAVAETNGRREHLEMFSLRAERTLRELESTLTELVRDAIKGARADVAKLVAEELEHG